MNNLFDIKDKVAIVTGSASGLGKAVAEGFEKAGAIVYGFDRKTGVDIADDYVTIDNIKAIYKKHKQIDILVNCAGISLSCSCNEMAFIETININLIKQFELIKKVAYYMKETGGSIINITSLAAEQGFADNPGYVASKSGMKGLTKALAKDLAESNIRVNNICPGYFTTDMTEKSWSDEKLSIERKERTILKRWGKPEEIIGAAIFLASDASSYITGIDLVVDGGWLANGV